MSKKQILLINVMAGYEKVATAAMLPNILYYGKFIILKATDSVKEDFSVLKRKASALLLSLEQYLNLV